MSDNNSDLQTMKDATAYLICLDIANTALTSVGSINRAEPTSASIVIFDEMVNSTNSKKNS